MAVTRRYFLASSSAVALAALTPEIGRARLLHGSAPPSGNSPIVVNFGGGDATATQRNSFLNIAKTWNPFGRNIGDNSLFAGANNYPSGNLTNPAANDIWLDSNYYGHYTLSWSVTSGTPGINNIGVNPLIVYSGADHCSISGISPSASGVLGSGMSVLSGATGANIEFAYGFLVNAVSSESSTGTALVKFTTTSLNFAFGLFEGQNIMLANVTGIPAGPWQVHVIDNNNFSLLGSNAYVGLVSLNTSGNVATNSQIIYSLSSDHPSLTGNFTSTNFSNLVWCKTADIADINAGKLVTPAMVNAFLGTNAAYIRFMDLMAVQAVQTPPWAVRIVPANFTWANWYFPIQCWAGTMTNAADTFTCPANPSNSPQGAGAAYVDGEVIVAQVGATAHNTTQNPKLGITGRAAAAPIFTQTLDPYEMTLAGSVPAIGTNLTITFNGGGLSSLIYTYTTTNSGHFGADTSFNVIAANIIFDLTTNPLSKAAVTSFLAAGWFAASADLNIFPSAAISFYYCPNLDSSGNASLGNGVTIVGNDPTAAMTFAIGLVPVSYLGNGVVMCFTYSTLLQGWIATQGQDFGGGVSLGGMRGTPPLEYCTELCARANSGMWYNIGVFDTASNIYNQVLTIAQAQYNGQNAVKTLALEWGNETWLGLNPQVAGIARALGFNDTTDGSSYSAHGLRTIQMAQQAVQAWSDAGRNRADLKIVNAYKFVEPIPGPLTSLTNTVRFGGSTLNGATGSNKALKNFGGDGASAFSTNASIAPNRPIDWSDWISPAPYVMGQQMNAGFGTNFNFGPLSNLQELLVAAYNYAYGNPTQQAAALDFLFNIGTQDGDFYKGTMHDGSIPDGYQVAGPLSLGSMNAYAGYAGSGTIAASYDASRVANGTSGGAQLKVGVGCYEGGWFMGPISAGELVGSLNGLGYTNGHSSSLPGAAAGPSGAGDTSTTAAANIYTLLNAFKNDARSAAWATKMFGDFRTSTNAGGARDNYFAWYGWQGNNIYSLYPGGVTGAAPYQPYNSIAAFR